MYLSNMKWSQFNCLFHSKKTGYFLHNTRMKLLVRLDETSYKRLQEISENPELAETLLDESDYTYLVNSKVLVSEHEDNNYIGKLEYKRRRESFTFNSLGIILCPTLACNFACPYCYEKNLPNSTMQESVQNDLINFINRHTDTCKFMALNWHGGEPLIAFNTIKQIYTKLESDAQLRISNSSMVSNGYLLNEEICKYLAEKKLNYLQITIDGNKETHNKTRILKNGGSSFEKIIENIDMATELMPNCQIGIRTNIGKFNREEYVELYKELSARWKGKNCFVYHTFVLDNDLDTCYDKRCSFELSTDEKNDFLVYLAQNGVIRKKSLYPRLDCSSYTCMDSNAFVIDPQGRLYKCWADVGKKERSIGDLNNGVTNYDIVSQFMIGSDKFSDTKCLKCSYLPVCDGGCNLYRVGYLEKNIPYDVCNINDKGLVKFVETYME